MFGTNKLTDFIMEITMSATLAASASAVSSSASRSKALKWTGRIMTGIAIIFLTMDAVVKLVGVKAAVEGTAQLGYQPHHLAIIGYIALACLVLYIIPRTAPLGAILWTGYFGGAVATHLRLDNPLFTHILSPIYFAAFLWIGLYIRDPRVRGLLNANR